MDDNEVELEPEAATPAPRRALGLRGLVIGAAIAVAVVLAGAGAFSVWGGAGRPADQAAPGPAISSPSPSPRPGADPGASPADGSEVPGDAGAAPGEGGPGAGEAPEASGPGGAPAPESTPFASGPLPPSASASGELVDGYPEPIMTPMSASDVLDSSIATEGDVMQVTLVARSEASEDEIRDHYRTVWSGSGLEPAGPQGSDTAFADGSTSLTLAFAPASGTGTVYVLLGVFRSR